MQCHICGNPATFTCRRCGRAGCNKHYSEGAICSQCFTEEMARNAAAAERELSRQRDLAFQLASMPKCDICHTHPGTYSCVRCGRSLCNEHAIPTVNIIAPDAPTVYVCYTCYPEHRRWLTRGNRIAHGFGIFLYYIISAPISIILGLISFIATGLFFASEEAGILAFCSCVTIFWVAILSFFIWVGEPS